MWIGNCMFFSIVVHNDTADDNNKNSCQDNKTGKNEEFEVRDFVPSEWPERFVDINEDESEERSKQYESDNIALFINVSWNIMVRPLHFSFIFGQM